MYSTSSEETKSVIKRLFMAYADYLQINEPGISDESIVERFDSLVKGYIEMYEEDTDRWSGNIATLLVVYADQYERLSASLIYTGATVNPTKTRFIL